mgnify:FL=1
MKILLVEDDPGIIHSLTEFLTGEGFSITSVPGQQEAVNAYRSARFDLALIDISLENGDGYAVCRAIKADRDIPVIFLTASVDEASVVTGLDLGADDYIAKPFRPRELVSRIRNARRRYGDQDHLIAIGDLLFDTDRGIVSRNGEEIPLSALEYRILQVFLLNRGILLSRTRLLEEIWDIAGDYVNDNTLTVYIKRIREKIERDPAKPVIIQTVRGLGYRMN